MATDLRSGAARPLRANLPYYAATAIIGRTIRLPTSRLPTAARFPDSERSSRPPGSRSRATREYGYFDGGHAPVRRSAAALRSDSRARLQPPRKWIPRWCCSRRKPILGRWMTPSRSWRLRGRSFQHKRKTLRNNLAETYGKELVEAWPKAGLRAEQITMAGFVECTAISGPGTALMGNGSM